MHEETAAHKTAVLPPRRGLAGKRRAILAGARTMFARGGFSGASIEAIAAEAEVSTRTIYNHFPGKLDLFEAVVTESTTEVAESQIALIDRHLGEVADLEAALVELGQSLAIPLAGHTEYFALIRQLDVESESLQDTIDAWREAGPARVNGALAGHLARLADQGLLRAADPTQAATHFLLLVQGAVPFHLGLGPTPEADIHGIVAAGVRVFLHGYVP